MNRLMRLPKMDKARPSTKLERESFVSRHGILETLACTDNSFGKHYPFIRTISNYSSLNSLRAWEYKNVMA